MPPTAPRLIENWLPINAISTEAVRERMAASALPPINWLHVWWARRPLLPSRAAIAASLLKADADPSAFYALIGTHPGVVAEQERLDAAKQSGVKLEVAYSQKRAFTHNPTADQAAWFQQNLADLNPARAVPPPVVLDVTAGGGSIPFEAGRLGLQTIANELNPVAALILRATCQWPQEYGPALLTAYQECAAALQARVNALLADLYPEEPLPDCAGGDCPHPQPCPLADSDFPVDKNQNTSSENSAAAARAHRYVWAYLWARAAACPHCQIQVPLSPDWRLDSQGTGIRLELSADGIAMPIVHDRAECSACARPGSTCPLAALYPNQSVSPGTVAKNSAIITCPACGSTAPKGYPAQEAQAGRLGHRLYCVIYRDSWRERAKNGRPRKKETHCRVFVTPEQRHFASSAQAAARLPQLRPQWETDDLLPTEALPDGNKTKDAIYYGMPYWRDMFTPRQQLAHGSCVQAFRECVDADAAAGLLDVVRRAAWGYVAFAVDKLLHMNCLLTRWGPGKNSVVGAFANHAFAFKWSYAEMAITCPGLGLEWSLSDIADCLSQLLAMAGGGDGAAPAAMPAIAAPAAQILCGDAGDLGDAHGQTFPAASVDCIVFDPPYEENVCYAELSDFFYVWLKRTAGYVFPADFAAYLTEKDQEAIASPARFKTQAAKGRSAKTLALADYQAKMAQIFAECRRVIKPEGIMTVMFNHKSTSAWDALTVALIAAGFAVTRTWPVKTEAESSLHIKGRAAARTTILLVCRPRTENPYPLPWHAVESRIATAVQQDLQDNLVPAGLRPIDLYLSAFGPALRVISEHWGTERETANPERPAAPFAVTPSDALQVARREVSRHRAREISREWVANPTDPAAKFYILAKDAAANDTLPFDEANLLARALGVRLEKTDPALKGIVRFNGDKVTLLSARDRLAARSIGEDLNPDGILDAVHTAVALTDRRNTLDAQRWLAQRIPDPQDRRFRATLEALLRTTKPGHDDYQAQRSLWQVLYAAEPPPPAAVQERLL